MPAQTWTTSFHAGSAVHWAVLATVAAGAALVVRAGRAARRRGPAALADFDRTFARALLAIWVGLLLYNLAPDRLGWDKSLPLHVCDVVGLAAPVGLLTRRRLPRAILYFWGVAYTTQAFITPSLYRGPAHPDFWAFWLCHGGILLAAAHEVFVRRYRPTWHDWRLTVAAAAAYVPVVLLVNARFGTNYGYLGRSDFCQAAAVLLFGPWPARVPRIYLAGAGATLALTLPWAMTNRVRRSRTRPNTTNEGRPLRFNPVVGRRAA